MNTLTKVERILAEYEPIKVWNKTDRFNLQLKRKRKGDIRYVLLISRTEKFNMTEDIQKVLDIRNKSHLSIVQRFASLGVVVEYFTIFSQRSKSRMGPVATDVPEKICLQKYKKLYFPFKNTITFIGSRYLAKKFPEDVRFISAEQFVADILFPSE